MSLTNSRAAMKTDMQMAKKENQNLQSRLGASTKTACVTDCSPLPRWVEFAKGCSSMEGENRMKGHRGSARFADITFR
jgi:hypothetical protein